LWLLRLLRLHWCLWWWCLFWWLLMRLLFQRLLWLLLMLLMLLMLIPGRLLPIQVLLLLDLLEKMLHLMLLRSQASREVLQVGGLGSRVDIWLRLLLLMHHRCTKIDGDVGGLIGLNCINKYFYFVRVDFDEKGSLYDWRH